MELVNIIAPWSDRNMSTAARDRLNAAAVGAPSNATDGGTVSAEEAAGLLHMTRQGVDRRRQAGKLIGLLLGRRGYRYPVWQFDTSNGRTGTVPCLEDVLDALADHDPWAQAIFMVN